MLGHLEQVTQIEVHPIYISRLPILKPEQVHNFGLKKLKIHLCTVPITRNKEVIVV